MNFKQNIFLSVAIKDDINDNLVGIRIKNKNNQEQLNVIFPIGYDLKDYNGIPIEYNQNNRKNYDEDIKKLIYWLSQEFNGDSKKTDTSNSFSFSAALKIIEDFYKCGLYKETEQYNNSTENGKINWNKTLNDHNNLIFWNVKKVLPKIYYKKTDYNYVGKIQEIQKYCLGYISKIIGIFYNFYYPSSIKKYEQSYMIHILDEEINKTNIDDKKQMLIHLKQFLSDSYIIDYTSENNSILKFGTKKFSSVWEKIVDEKFEGISLEERRKDFYPNAYFVDKNLENPTSLRKSQPDTIIKKYIDDDYLIILDSKYYSSIKTLSEYDVNKQLRYGQYAYTKTGAKIINIFIMPEKIDSKKKYELCCFVTNDYVANDSNYLKYVAVCCVDTKYLICEDNMTQLLDDMINEIKNILE